MDTTFHISNIRKDSPKPGNVIIYWLSGSGFAFKFASGEVVCIDPYLSDSIERMHVIRRLSLAPIRPEELHFDYLIITHDHGDHLDIDSFDALISANPGCSIIAPECCKEYLHSKSIVFEIAAPGKAYSLGDIKIKIVKADHGQECPTAIGCLIEFAEHCIYFTGDSAYNESIMAPIIAEAPDIVIPCMNGAFGNMDEEESSTLVAQCNAKITIPSHFGLSAEHGGCPQKFINHVNEKSPNTKVILLTPGRGQEIF